MSPPPYLVGPAAVTENLLKRKWSKVILRHLDNGLHTPVEICRMEPDLTQMALNERLRSMLRYSLVTRYTRYPENGAEKQIVYRLTLRGQKVLQMLTLIERLDELNDKDQIILRDEIPAPGRPDAGRPQAPKRLRKNSQSRNVG